MIKVDYEKQIDICCAGLTQAYHKSLRILSNQNVITICEYISAMKSETNISNHYRECVIKTLSLLSRHCNNKPFKSMVRENAISFLDKLRNETDPMHGWIGTYNNYNITITRFFKWLYNPHMTPKNRPKPTVVENITNKKRNEISIYSPNDLWSEEEDLLFMRHCPSKRIKCYHAVSRDSSCRPHEILKLTIKSLQFKTSGSSQYCEVLVNGKTGSRHIPLINSIPYVKDYLDHEHPCPNNQNAAFIARSNSGRHILRSTLTNIYQDLKNEYFPSLLDSHTVSHEDKEEIRALLRKPWNPYVRRHTGLTEKSLMLNSNVLNQYAGWEQGSPMGQKYLHYFSNQSSNSLLEAYGIVPTDKQQTDILKPKQCPNCNESANKPDAKFCVKCRTVLTYDGYAETQEKERQRDMEVIKLGDRVKDLEQIKEDLCKMHDEYHNAMRQELNMTDEERKKEHEMELRETYAPGKYQRVKLMEEVNGKWQEIRAASIVS